MDWFQAPDYWLSRFIFERALAAIYLIAFVVTVNQFPALLGERGLAPVRRFMELASVREAPSIFYMHYSDRFLRAVGWFSVALSVSLLAGLPQSGPAWVVMLAWFVLWALYLSIVNVGQTFYSFGWETLLLETGFIAIFLGPARIAPPVTVMYLIRWLLFRVEFGAGLIKIRGDTCWRDLTCLYYHHETQPMPNPLSWYFHHLPKPLHRVEVAGSHFAQLVVPFALFAPQPVAAIAGLVILVHQGWLVLSGNFSWLNVITMALAVAAFDDGQLGFLSAARPATLQAPATWYMGVVIAYTVVVLGLSYWPVRNLLSRRQLMNASFNPFHLVGTYGAFGSITRERYEIVLEGTADRQPTASTVWKEYEFKGKPGDPRRLPPQIAPYHLRLDWLMWFAAMSPPMAHPWIVSLVEKLLMNDKATLRLIARSPFGKKAPKVIRGSLYLYHFTSWQEHRQTGDWWARTRVGDYLPPLHLSSSGQEHEDSISDGLRAVAR
jgi:hypothetical protein